MISRIDALSSSHRYYPCGCSRKQTTGLLHAWLSYMWHARYSPRKVITEKSNSSKGATHICNTLKTSHSKVSSIYNTVFMPSYSTGSIWEYVPRSKKSNHIAESISKWYVDLINPCRTIARLQAFTSQHLNCVPWPLPGTSAANSQQPVVLAQYVHAAWPGNRQVEAFAAPPRPLPRLLPRLPLP